MSFAPPTSQRPLSQLTMLPVWLIVVYAKPDHRTETLAACAWKNVLGRRQRSEEDVQDDSSLVSRSDFGPKFSKNNYHNLTVPLFKRKHWTGWCWFSSVQRSKAWPDWTGRKRHHPKRSSKPWARWFTTGTPCSQPSVHAGIQPLIPTSQAAAG